MTMLEQYKLIITRIDVLIRKWMDARPTNFGYTTGAFVRMNYENNTIVFDMLPMSSGIGMLAEMSAKFLDDDSGLEVEAKAWYDEYQQETNTRWKRLFQLEQSEEVQEWKKLDASRFNALGYGKGYSSIHVIPSATLYYSD